MIVVLLFFLVSSVASVDLSLTSGELCEGAVATWTCVVDGIILGWRNLGQTVFPSLSPNLVPLGSGSPFNTNLTSINGSIITSIATASLTSAVNGSLLECSDSGFTSPSTNVTLILKDPEAANLSSPVFYGDGIRVSWSGAICAASYRLSVYLSVFEVDVIIVTDTTYVFVPERETFGQYSFQLTSIDYLGNDTGSINSASISWKDPKFFVYININNSIANFTFENGDDERPPVIDCSITFDGVLKSCVIDSNIVIFNITSGAKHSYNINITNAAGTVNMNGELSNEVQNRTIQLGESIGPLAIAAPPAVLGVLIILSVGWVVLRICWKRQWCCTRIWRSSFWLLFFCYDCCTYDVEVKEGNTVGLKNPNIGGEKGNDTPL